MDHPTQRLLERTNLPESYPDRLRSAVKGLSLPRGVVHARMPDGSFAVFKDAGGKKRLATFLSKHMSPPGRDVTSLVKEKLTMKKSANHMVEPSPDGGNYMAVSNLKSLKRNSEDLMCHIDAYTPLPDWVESKLNVAAASIDDVADWFRNGGELNKTADFADESLAQRAHDKVVKEHGLTPQDGSEYWRMKTRIYKSMGGTFTGKRGKKASLSLMSVAKDLRKTAGVYELMLKHSEEGLKPPAGVASAARRGLELRRKASPSNKGGLTASEASKQGIGSGVQRASNLANGDSVSPSTVKRMHSFFSRHEGNSAIGPENKGKPQNDKGYVSHLLWGGDAGKRWSSSQAKKLSEKEAADSIATYLEQFV